MEDRFFIYENNEFSKICLRLDFNSIDIKANISHKNENELNQINSDDDNILKIKKSHKTKSEK